jgi:phosphinothricin acetyltransferase
MHQTNRLSECSGRPDVRRGLGQWRRTAGRHALNPRAAYQWSTETSIYIAANHHRTGGGRKLYAQLLQRLSDRGYRRAFADIAQPNELSNNFHRAFGFQHAGVYRRVGWKRGRWHDVAWMQLDLVGAAEDNHPPTPITCPVVRFTPAG